ncbi:MAG TPA: hypothetical protein VN947_27500 [Polyangia bacterium]|nr:hypothetical protein [Polyangia bacterium]
MLSRLGLALSAWRLVARRVLLVGGALVVGGVLAVAIGGAPASLAPAIGHEYRLVLDAESDPPCVYGSAWNDGDVVMPHDNTDGKTVKFTSRYDFQDGCTWEATETLTPSETGYDYEYVEHIVECKKDATPGLACPRHGHVTVVPAL